MEQPANVPNHVPEAMGFSEFLAWRQEVAQAGPDAALLCETRIARAYASLRPKLQAPEGKVHRCDLARRWCGLRGVPMAYEKTALVCQGVRHALGLLFGLCAAQGQRVGLPQDVYPVYWQIASQAGLQAVGFSTFPGERLSTLFHQATQARLSVLLLPAPFKLQGRPWNAQDVDDALRWLAADPARRLILDGVYAFGLPLDALMRRLIETDQVLYLDSLSKGWLHERVFGVAVVPVQDKHRYAPVFQQLPASQETLGQAAQLLFRHADVPALLVQHIDAHRRAMVQRLESAGLQLLPATQGYLVGVKGRVTALLREQHILALPASAFGCDAQDWSIASALPPGGDA